ncbi:MAG: TIGR02996 domain-containing protein [Archangium sp.]|nr:TIGR02996 domain-containing protein [Archangium sp.]
MASREEDELLAAIWARPDDDTPRLVYADYLMEQQNPRGEFIRLQCESTALHDHHPRKLEYERRAAALLHPNRLAWSPSGGPAFEWRFVRGFPASVKLAAPALLQSSASLQTVKSLEGLELNFNGVTEPLAEVWTRVFKDPIFERLRTLRLTWHVPQVVVRALCEQSWLSRLSALQLSWVSLREDTWKTLGATATLRTLQSLDVGLSGATDEGVEALASIPWPKLTRLSLSNNQLGTRACEALARKGTFSALEHLDVSWNRVGKKGGAVLAGAEFLASLQSLNLSHDQVGDDTCAALAAAKPQKLRWLGLEQSRVTDTGFKLLSKELPHVFVHSHSA